MTVLKVKPVSKNLSVFNDFDRIFDEFFRTDSPAPAVHSAAVVANSRPAVNVIETSEGFLLELAAPGLDKSDFQISVDKNVLNIEVNKEFKKEEGEIYKRRDFGFHSFKRVFRLPETIDTNGIVGAYTNGILSVTLPKKEEAKEKPARTIEIA